MKVLAGGCFNKLHKGHVCFLKRAKRLGFLVVVLASNKINMAKNGNNAIPAIKRKESLEKLGIADKAVVGSKSDYMAVVRSEKPDIIALGYDQRLPDARIERMGIKVVKIGKMKQR